MWMCFELLAIAAAERVAELEATMARYDELLKR
jgi:hypothetical protein